MQRILLTGKTGQVGWELQRTLAPLGAVIARGRAEMDLSDPDAIRRAIRDTSPNVILNAAAYTAVEKAESEPGIAMQINGIAPGVMAEEAKRTNALLVHYSTDYVFDGNSKVPYSEDDEPKPINVYGKTKLEGERAIQASGCAHFILRTSWVYSGRGKNFLLTIIKLASEQDELRIVDDQVGAPTWSRMIAEATSQILAQFMTRFPHRGNRDGLSGVYHLSAAGRTSWYGFANAILAEASSGSMTSRSLHARRVVPIKSSEYPTRAARPENSQLSNEKLAGAFGIALPDWRCGLVLCLAGLINS